MERRRLGATDLEVSRLGLGGLFVSSLGGNDGHTARDVIGRAMELGVNFIDTAPTYADSESLLGEALAGVADRVFLSTKIGGGSPDFDPRDAAQLRGSVERSLERLGRDAIDVLMVHEPDRPGQYDWWADSERFVGPVTDVMADLKGEGLVHFTGLAGTTAYELTRIVKSGAFDVVLTAFNYSLLWTEAALTLLPEAVQAGMGIIAGSPLQQGALSRRFDKEVLSGAHWLSSPRRAQFIELYALADEIEMPIAELAIRFVTSNPAIDMVLMGARSVGEVEQNVAAVEAGPLPEPVLARLSEIAAMVPFRPYAEPLGLPFDRDYIGPGPA